MLIAGGVVAVERHGIIAALGCLIHPLEYHIMLYLAPTVEKSVVEVAATHIERRIFAYLRSTERSGQHHTEFVTVIAIGATIGYPLAFAIFAYTFVV